MPDTDLRHAHTGGPELRSAAGPRGADGSGAVRGDVPGLAGVALRTQPARSSGGVQAAGSGDAGAGALARGRGDASGGGRADGDVVGDERQRGADLVSRAPRFDVAVGPDGYAWIGCNGRAVGLSFAIGREFARALSGTDRRDLMLPFSEPQPLPFHRVARRVAPLALLRYRWRDRQEI